MLKTGDFWRSFSRLLTIPYENKPFVEPEMGHWELYQVVKLFCYQVLKSGIRALEIIKYVGLQATLALRGPPGDEVACGSAYLMIFGARKGPNESLKDFEKMGAKKGRVL